MFKFLKDKLKSAVGSFSKKTEEEITEEVPVEATKEPVEEPAEREEPIEEETKEPVEELAEREEPGEDLTEDIPVEDQEIKPLRAVEPLKTELSTVPVKTDTSVAKDPEQVFEVKPETQEKKPGFFGRIKDKVTKRSLSEDKFEDLFFELEVAMLENNMALEVIEKIKNDLKHNLVDEKIPIGKSEEYILNTLKESINGLFNVQKRDIETEARDKKPYKIVFLGVNGVGKTTTIAKLAYALEKKGMKSVMAAADTFRAAAIQQLEEHAKKLNIKMIKHDYGSDPAAVAFDAIKYGESKNLDIVLIDTAGRQHSNANLMEEMKKIIRITNPDLKIFVGESITGNDCVDQARAFDEAVGIDCIILTKADVDDKGGAAISISYVTGKPIIYLGMGQDYDSLKPFEQDIVTSTLFA